MNQKAKCLMISISLFSFVSSAQTKHRHQEEVKSLIKNLTELRSTPEVECSTDNSLGSIDPRYFKDSEGFHGMLLFGQETIYISHLPMYHAPHDYQAIVEVTMSDSDKHKYLTSGKGYDGYYTFAPDGNFVLPKKLDQKGSIHGKLVRGHFERGGTEVSDVSLDIVRVVYFKKLNPGEPKKAEESYIVFGKGTEYFLAHEVGRRPNVDEIIPVRGAIPGDMMDGVRLNGAIKETTLKIEKDKLSFVHGGKVQVLSYKTFYRETGDLE